MLKFVPLLLFLCLYGCIAPVNSAFESARMLNKGDFEIQGNSSVYLNSEPYVNDFSNINNNFGGALTIGVSRKYNLKLRYEGIIVIDNFYQFFDNTITTPKIVNFVEIGNKINIIDQKVAFSIPLGLYIAGGDVAVMLKPRVIFSPYSSQHFQLNIIPRMHIGVGSSIQVFPAINIGLGLSQNLNKWAIRPEIGYDGHFTGGIGYSYFFSRNNSRQ